MDRTRNLEGSARVGIGGGTYLCRRIQEKREAGMGGDLYSNRNPDTHAETHTDRGTDTHRHALSRSPVFHPIGAITADNARPTGQVGNW